MVVPSPLQPSPKMTSMCILLCTAKTRTSTEWYSATHPRGKYFQKVNRPLFDGFALLQTIIRLKRSE